MTSEFEAAAEPKDRTKLIWLGVAILFAAMIVGLWMAGRPAARQSTVRAKHILIRFDASDPTDRARALERITELRQRIENGESFAKLAQEFSDEPASARRGGLLADQPKGNFAAEFEQYVWSAPIGELSEPIQTEFGFHLIVVVERHISDVDRYEMELDRRAREALEEAPSQMVPPSP